MLAACIPSTSVAREERTLAGCPCQPWYTPQHTCAIWVFDITNNTYTGNPDWQSQSLEHVDTMFDAVEYSMGWLEFWLQRAEAVGKWVGGWAAGLLGGWVAVVVVGERVQWGGRRTTTAAPTTAPSHTRVQDSTQHSFDTRTRASHTATRASAAHEPAADWANEAVRVGEFGDVSYVRMMVNIDRNCDPSINSSLACYRDDSLTQHLSGGGGGNGGGQKYANLLEWAGWQDVSSIGGNPTRKSALVVVVAQWVDSES